ncbi:LINE-1 retrotransposable element ORF2 protein [Chionoecetes opilio]|uniref:LINE-1 retrotransposable element ORF2 protein n=1 Tax=Chionoecetes opilio TaxID=41210 RepID=A0A8J4XQN9_CHIOP|nr:LINE-1 retrotransposable element ORF2 protein [Chionoecetes opilio]
MLLESLLQFVEDLRSQFDDFEAKAMAKCNDCDPCDVTSNAAYYANTQCIRKRTRHHDELDSAEDVTLTGRDKFRVTAFLPIIDKLCAALQQRLAAYSDLREKFGFLSEISKKTNTELKEAAEKLVSSYPRDLEAGRSAEFFGTDHKLVVATLKLHVKSRRISRGNHTVFHLEKLKDLTCAHEYAVAVSNRFDVLGALGDPVELWDTFKRETLQAAKECIGERPRSRRGFVSTETLEKIEESRAARLAGNQDQHRALSRRTRTLLGRDKERHVRSLAEDVEGHFNANDLRPAYRALKKLRSKSPSRASANRTADGRLVSDMNGQIARWAEYFGQLLTVNPPTEQLHTTGLQAVDADPPIDKTAPSLDEVREAVAKLRGGKAAGVCNISAELLKAGGEAMIRGLHAVLTAVWQSGTIPHDWKRGLVVPIWQGKGDRQDCNNYRGITLLSVPGKVLTHLLLSRIRSHLVKHQRHQQSGFTPGK